MKKLLIIPLAIAVAACSQKQDSPWYYAPSSIILESPSFDVATYSVEISAIYNGEDAGISSASFKLYDQDSVELKPSSFAYSEGRARAVFAPLSEGNQYSYDFSIQTIGGNTIRSACASFDYSKPHDFEYGTITTSTSKILTMTYKGLDAFISEASLVMTTSTGMDILDAPAVSAGNGSIKALFHLDEWPQDLYSCSFSLKIEGGEQINTPSTNFNLLPVPEKVTLASVDKTADSWTLVAEHDGEDRTIESALFEVVAEDGTPVASVPATVASKQIRATIPAQDYGIYKACCTLALIDGTSVSSGFIQFKHSRPRPTETFIATQEQCKEGGILTSDVIGPQSFTVGAYEFETSYLRYRVASSGDNYLVNGSSRKGYLQNLTEFQYGIKEVRLNLSQGDRLVANYQCSGRKTSSAEWTIVAESQPTAKQFVYDLSSGDYHFFRWESKGVKELRILSFEIDYYTEPLDE